MEDQQSNLLLDVLFSEDQNSSVPMSSQTSQEERKMQKEAHNIVNDASLRLTFSIPEASLDQQLDIPPAFATADAVKDVEQEKLDQNSALQRSQNATDTSTKMTLNEEDLSLLEDSLEDEGVEIAPEASTAFMTSHALQDSPFRRRIKRLTNEADHIKTSADKEGHHTEAVKQEPKRIIKKRVCVRSTLDENLQEDLDDDLENTDGSNKGQRSKGVEEAECCEEDVDGDEVGEYWDEEDEYADHILNSQETDSHEGRNPKKKQGGQSKRVKEEAAKDDESEEISGADSESEHSEEDKGTNEDCSENPAEMQRRLRVVAAHDGIGKGFVPEIKPIGDLVAKLKNRTKEVVKRAQAALTAQPPPQKEALPIIDFKVVLELVARKQSASKGPLQQDYRSTRICPNKEVQPEPLPNLCDSDPRLSSLPMTMTKSVLAAPAPVHLEVDDNELLKASALPVAQHLGDEDTRLKATAQPPQDLMAVDYEDDDLEIVDEGPGKILKAQLLNTATDDADLDHPDVDPNLMISNLKAQDSLQVRPRALDEGNLGGSKQARNRVPPGRASRFLAIKSAVRLQLASSVSLPDSQTLPNEAEVLELQLTQGDDGGAGAAIGASDSEELIAEEERLEETDAEEEDGNEEASSSDEAGPDSESGDGDDGDDVDDGIEEATDEAEEEEDESTSEESQQLDDIPEAEPLAYEEEEHILNPMESPNKRETGGNVLQKVSSEVFSAEVAKAQVNGADHLNSKLSPRKAAAERNRKKKKSQKGRSRFVEMEAELSDEEGQGAEVSEDEYEPDVEEDGMLQELIEEVQEGQRDFKARAEVHKRWEEEQDMRDVRAILHGIQNGFKRGRQDEEEEDGTDLEARRRRAALFADDNEIQVDVLPGLLEVVEELEEVEDDYSKQKHEAARKRLLAAGGITAEQDVGIALQSIMTQDYTAREVIALMNRSNSNILPASVTVTDKSSKAAVVQQTSKGHLPARLTTFGKNLTNLDPQQGSSFLGRTAATSLHRTASNAASKSFVFGMSESSNSMHTAAGENSLEGAQNTAGGRGPVRPSSFAGLKGLIGGSMKSAAGARKESAPSLLSLLGKRPPSLY
ncbi:hypothetical protein CEUSTIGMA_g10880.t1 [Chlamydomonas eustigma]|uniref:DNA replication checkpoint mediator MRC1 domain-containing protein n=1 Tax=Chlamydomonas eustigma TaxID=1157962 RepID=A0A250XK45_9CHLO|nr:hypothetical protein CEUSTIGMA_g10880.t1 [Chlamydomonas eustigma]|eukprot:GAX83455.1 hypothetical protein CEUSTIGMA_g10880.t1 [Chlamydomonas eustigma]